MALLCDLRERLVYIEHSIGERVLIIVGEHDAEKPSAIKLQSAIANSTLHVIEGMGHFGVSGILSSSTR